MKNIIILLTICVFCTYSLKAQSKAYDDMSYKIRRALFSQFQNSGCPDSAGLYVFKVKIDLRKKNTLNVEINVEDSLFYKIFKDKNVLKKIDYSNS